MKYTTFNSYRVSRLALGTVQLGMDYGIANRHGAPSVSEAMQLLRACSQAGINSYDTSPTYGSSEDVLGKYVKENKPKKPFVVSKFKYDLSYGSDIEGIWKEVRQIVEESLARLGLKKLPLLLYHKGASESMEQVKTFVPILLSRLKNEGFIEHGGVSLYYSLEADELLDDQSFDGLQIPLNVLDQGIVGNGTLRKLHENGKLIMVRSVFLQGLFWKDPAELNGKLRMSIPYLNSIRKLASENHLTVAELVFGFVRDLPWVDSLVIGAENTAQVEANLQLLNGPQIPADVLENLRSLSERAPLELITPALWN